MLCIKVKRNLTPTASLLTNAFIFIIKGNSVNVGKKEHCILKDEKGLYRGVMKRFTAGQFANPDGRERDS